MKKTDSIHYQREVFEPGLTVVVPVYNRADMVKEMIESVLIQKRPPEALVLVDDHSTDGTLDVLRIFSEQELPFELTVLMNRSKGATSARNTGLERVTTEWTMFFDSDDLMLPEHIETAWSTLLNNRDADIVGWDVERIEIDGRRRVLPFESAYPEWSNIMHGTFATQRYMARTRLFRESGGWNESQPIWNDIELGARLLKLNPKIGKAESLGPTVKIRANAASITGDRWSSRIDQYKVALENLARVLGPEKADWIRLKASVLAADIAREDSGAGKSFYKGIPGHDFRTRLVYEWRRHGLRGAARVFKPLFKGKGET
ncbi:MAG: glycosyltransferase family 2 protein [Muribaculaceae bacterium]|nr:glycosyltransferase family 2 protein [Muribaculaceae bacterium]